MTILPFSHTGDASLLDLPLIGAARRVNLIGLRQPSAADFGFRAGDLTHDNGPCFQEAHDWGRNRGGVDLKLGAGMHHVGSNASFTALAHFRGIGAAETPRNGLGTSLHVAPGFIPFVFTGGDSRGGGFSDMGIVQDHPAPVAGQPWTPVHYPHVFRVQDTGGRVRFERLHFAGVKNGISYVRGGRLWIDELSGHFFENAVEIEYCYDECAVRDIHVWPYFAPASDEVNDYCIGNCDAIKLGRVDGIEIGRAFSIFTRSGIRVSGSPALPSLPGGSVSRGQVNSFYPDGAKYGLWIDETAHDVTLDIDSFRNGGERLNASGPPTTAAQSIPGARAIRIDGSAYLSIPSMHGYYTEGSQIELTNPNRASTLHFGKAWFNAFDNDGSGDPAITAVQCGPAPHAIYFGTEPVLSGSTRLVNYDNSNVKIRTPEPQSHIVSGAVEGATYGWNNSYPHLLLAPAAPLNTLTFQFPENPEDRQVVTLNTLQPIAAVTFRLAPTHPGQTGIFGAPASLSAGIAVRFRFFAQLGQWVRD